MKTLKIIPIILSLLLFIHQQVNAQCTPAASLPNQGIFPDTFPSAKVTVAYSQVLQFLVNKDTNIVYNGQNVAAKVDSIRILDMMGLPPGFGYQCNKPGCNVLGGEIGCALVSGTTTQMGLYPLIVHIKVIGKVFFFNVWLGITQVDSNTSYSIRVNSLNGIFEIVDHSQPVKVYPNPAQNKLFIDAKTLRGNKFKIKIFDTNGAMVLSDDLEVYGRNEINITSLSPGIYLAEVDDGNKISHAKFIVQ
ncbi:MAG: T9SS type A sorting domain-containing protein [Bacteroidia bacterium]